MDNLEQKIRSVLSSISYGTTNLLDCEFIKFLEVKDDTASLYVLENENTQELQKSLKKADEELRKIDAINEIKIYSAQTEEELKQFHSTGKVVPQAQKPQRTSFLQNYKTIIAVASGKGGVGKSTVAVNLSLALQKKNYKVALFDADIYGPSLPAMLGVKNLRPQLQNNSLLPIKAYGLEFMSIGSLIEEKTSVVWRGPMVHQAIEQLIRDTTWSGGDFMLIDMPPGTGDIQISLSQLAEITGTVIVCTPQDVALQDARRAITMFEKVNIPIIGMIENMSSFICPHCQKQTPIFGKGGTEKESKNTKIPFLDSLPIDTAIRIGGDNGKPIVIAEPQGNIARVYDNIADNLLELLQAMETE